MWRGKVRKKEELKNTNNNIYLSYQELQKVIGMKYYQFFKQHSRFNEILSFLILAGCNV
jgi:hypothetical protein